jgi:Arc/MetJ family transcription regulator
MTTALLDAADVSGSSVRGSLVRIAALALLGYPLEDCSMKTTIDVDRSAATKAARVLGTHSLKDTVNAALREVLAAMRRRRLAQRVRLGTLPVPSRSEMARLRAPRMKKNG